MWTIVLLILSNIFMTLAWYGHLKWMPRGWLPVVILLSWMIALPEYALAVPANRIGQDVYGLSKSQLKVIQEVISLTVFVFVAWLVLGEAPTWRTGLAFGLIAVAVWLVMFSGGPNEQVKHSRPDGPPVAQQ